MRLFIAVKLDGNIMKNISDFMKKLPDTKGGVKWVETENIHLTLKFLGEVNEDRLGEIKNQLSKIKVEQMNLKSKGTGAFPTLSRPRVFWIGLEGETNQLKSMAKEIDEKLNKLGFEKEARAFSAHITIGRVKTHANEDVLTFLKNHIDKEFGEMVIDCFYLIQSILKKEGPKYKVLETFKSV